MAGVKLMGAILMLALAFGWKECDAMFFPSTEDLCAKISHEVEAKSLKDQEVLDYAVKYLSNEGNIFDMFPRNKLKKALEMARNLECHDDTMEYLETITNCKPKAYEPLAPIAALASEYKQKCLTPEYFQKMLQKYADAIEAKKALRNSRVFTPGASLYDNIARSIN